MGNDNFFATNDLILSTLEKLTTEEPSIKIPQWRKFNEKLGGFRMNEFSVFCGSTGSGKTQFLANLSASMVHQNIKHCVFSIETGAHDFLKRVLSVMASEDLNTGNVISKEKLQEVCRRSCSNGFLQVPENLYLSKHDNRVHIDVLLEDLEHANKTLGCKMALIDNINYFLEPSRAQDMILEMDTVIHNLVIKVKSLDMHVLMVMHPRKTDDNARVKNEFDIKGSSTAVQEASNIFLWNRPKTEEIDNGVALPTDRHLLLAKIRRCGKHTGETIRYGFRNDTQFYDKFP